MNSIRVLLNAVKDSNIKISVTMNTGITYRCYVIYYIDTNCFRVCNKFEAYSSPDNDNTCENKKYNTIDVRRVSRVVVRASR